MVIHTSCDDFAAVAAEQISQDRRRKVTRITMQYGQQVLVHRGRMGQAAMGKGASKLPLGDRDVDALLSSAPGRVTILRNRDPA